MARHRTFNPLDTLPASWANTLMDFLSTAQANFAVIIKPGNSTRLQVPAGPDNSRAAVAVQGRWRWAEAPVEVVGPSGGSLRTLDVYVTASDNDFTPAEPAEVDNTNYSFGLALTESGAGAPGGVALSRLVARARWNGSAFGIVVPITGAVPGVVPIGGQVPWGGTSDPLDPNWLLADGRLVDRSTYAGFFAQCGHVYNGGVSPGGNMVRLPDKRGRASIGADDMGTVQGSAGRLAYFNRQVGQSGGEEVHVLAWNEMPQHAHAPAAGNAFAIVQPGVTYGWGLSGGSYFVPVAANGATGNAGASYGHNNMPPNQIDNAIVRVS